MVEKTGESTAPGGRGGTSPERWSAWRKSEAVLQLLRGEDLAEVSWETQVPAYELDAWRRVFIEQRQQGLKGRRWAPGKRQLFRIRAKLAEVTVRMALAKELLERGRR